MPIRLQGRVAIRLKAVVIEVGNWRWQASSCDAICPDVLMPMVYRNYRPLDAAAECEKYESQHAKFVE